jgi:uncharacterized protein (TIGR02145 family)
MTGKIMKYKLFALALLTASLLCAQETELPQLRLLEKPRLLGNEFVGSSHKDVNGRTAAALKIISDMDGFAYKANNGIIGLDHQPGVDIVYVTPDERILRVYKTGYGEFLIILLDEGVSLRERQVWELKITGDKKPVNVTILTEPADAEKYIDGELLGTERVFAIVPGYHTLKVRKEGYRSIERQIEVTESNVLFEDLRLQELELAPVQIRSIPKGATVLFDGLDRGKTDLGVWYYPGSYELKLSLEGYLPVTQRITVLEGETNTFIKNLTKNAAYLNLDVNPDDATITIQGKNYSPGELELIPGNYTVHISRSGYLSQSFDINLELEQRISRSVTLIKNVGALDLTVSPGDVNIFINKENMGNQRRIDLAPGRYRLELEKEGWNDISEMIEIELGATLNKSYTLSQKVGKLQFSMSPLDAAVTLKSYDGSVSKTWNGMQLLKDLPIGDYTLTALMNGYETQTLNFTIEENKSASVNIVLKEKVEGESQQSQSKSHMTLIIETGAVEDIDGNVYQIVRLGNQWWMAENLRVTRYRDGVSIHNSKSNLEWKMLRSSAMCWYDNISSKAQNYGALYNWYAVANPRGLAPLGWRVPTDQDWKKLEEFLSKTGISFNEVSNQNINLGSKLKSNIDWNGTNTTRFNAVPSGYRDGNKGNFDRFGNYAYFWSSSEFYSYNAFCRYLFDEDTVINREPLYKTYGLSVRCVRDAEVYTQVDTTIVGKNGIKFLKIDNIKSCLIKLQKLFHNLFRNKNKENFSVSPEMLIIKGGTFLMGSDEKDDEEPVHQVTVNDFSMSRYEITQKEYTALMFSNPSIHRGSNKPVEEVSWYATLVFCNRLSIQKGLTPVYTILKHTDPDMWGSIPTNRDSIWDAVICNWNADGYRLPTEAEWEYAASGGFSEKTKWAGTNSESNLGDFAWYAYNANHKTNDVGTKQSNSFGLYDMSGNVWEWCWDWYGSYSPDSQTNPMGSNSGYYRVLRGGSCYSNASNCRVIGRGYFDPCNSTGHYGFRIARSI